MHWEEKVKKILEDVERPECNLGLTKALWKKSFTRSDFYGLLAWHTPDIRNTAQAKLWAQNQIHRKEF